VMWAECLKILALGPFPVWAEEDRTGRRPHARPTAAPAAWPWTGTSVL